MEEEAANNKIQRKRVIKAEVKEVAEEFIRNQVPFDSKDIIEKIRDKGIEDCQQGDVRNILKQDLKMSFK